MHGICNLNKYLIRYSLANIARNNNTVLFEMYGVKKKYMQQSTYVFDIIYRK